MVGKIEVLATLMTRRLANGGGHSRMVTKPTRWKRIQRTEKREKKMKK